MIKNSKTQITSSKVEFKSKDNRSIKGYIDKKEGNDSHKTFVIISPGYAETKRDYISTSYYLANNNFTVLRYDCLDHLGESDGEIINFTLLDMEFSILAAMDYVQNEFGVKEIGIVASSLSGRTAFKIAASDKRIKYIVALTSVVDLRDTISLVYKEDLIGEYKDGKRWGAIDMMGFELKDDFLKESINNKYDDLNSTIEDINKIDAPICYLVAEDDAWISYDDMEEVYRHTKNRISRLVKIPGALHQIQENPKLAQQAIMKIAEVCIEYSGLVARQGTAIQQPAIHDIVVQNKIELVNLKNIFSVTGEDEKKFWVNYLEKFFVIIKSKDYQNLLSLVAQLLGDIEEDSQILDAGCGNGNFGAWLLCNMESRIKLGNSRFSFTYTGLDFAESAVNDAKRVHTDILDRILPSEEQRKRFSFKYVMADLEKEIPLRDNSFNKICCNLVLSYVTNYSKALKNMHSKLKKSGKIVVSSLKPYNDLSLVYKNYLDQNLSEEDILEGRKLLSSAGKIRHKEKQGHYHFFSEEELNKLLEQAGFVNINTYRSFGNQANVAVAEKS